MGGVLPRQDLRLHGPARYLERHFLGPPQREAASPTGATPRYSIPPRGVGGPYESRTRPSALKGLHSTDKLTDRLVISKLFAPTEHLQPLF